MPTQAIRRRKMFGEGRCVPLDGNTKVRIMMLARALSHPTEKGKHWGVLTAKFILVLDALLFGFHNAATGRCFPSYERIAEKARVSDETVRNAIHALEGAGILSWVNRWVRRWEEGRRRVVRTSNQYAFNDPKASDPKFMGGTEDPNSLAYLVQRLCQQPPPPFDPANPLHAALMRLEAEVKRSAGVGIANSVPRLVT